MANERKNWLQVGMNERKMRREAGLPEIFLYQKDTKSVTYREFVNKELILFSNGDNERSIPSMVDGMLSCSHYLLALTVLLAILYTIFITFRSKWKALYR